MDPALDQLPAPLGGVDEWVERALTDLTGVADVVRAGVALVEGGGRRLLFTASDRLRDERLGWCHVDAYTAVPLNDVIRTGHRIVGGLDALDARYDAYVAAQDGTGYAAVACVPLTAGGRVLGGFVLYFDRPQVFDADQCDELDLAGDRLAGLLSRTWGRPTTSVVAEHEAPDGSLVASHEFPPVTSAVAEARQFFSRTLVEWQVPEETVSYAVLCLSELVTNAIVHTTGGCHVQVELRDDVLTTRVRDNGSSIAPAVVTAGGSVRGDGHGLRLVEAIASRSGRTADHAGATAWFALETS